MIYYLLPIQGMTNSTDFRVLTVEVRGFGVTGQDQNVGSETGVEVMQPFGLYSRPEATNTLDAMVFRDHDVEEFIVQGHSQPVGNQGAQWLYSVNSLAVVRDDITQSRFQDASRTMLVTRVEFRGDRDSGQTTVVRLHPPHAPMQ